MKYTTSVRSTSSLVAIQTLLQQLMLMMIAIYRYETLKTLPCRPWRHDSISTVDRFDECENSFHAVESLAAESFIVVDVVGRLLDQSIYDGLSSVTLFQTWML